MVTFDPMFFTHEKNVSADNIAALALRDTAQYISMSWLGGGASRILNLKVPKREIFDRSDFPDFYTIKSSWVGDLLVKILT